MKRFIVRLIIFIAPVIITGITIELLLRNIPNDYRYKKEYLDKHASEIEVLILGNSHFYYGVDPQYFHFKSFNAAYPSQPLNYDMAIINKYAHEWDSLKYIILPVDFFSLYQTLDGDIESWRIKDYRIYYDINISQQFVYPSEIVNTTINIILKRLREYYINNKPAITSSKLGWGTTFTFKNRIDLNASGINNAKMHTAKDGVYMNPIHFKSILTFAKGKNIKVFIVTSPTYKTYYTNLDKRQLAKTVNTIKAICSSYSNVKYINLLTCEDFIADDFYDADHLNEFGAKKLSQKLDSLITESLQKEL